MSWPGRFPSMNIADLGGAVFSPDDGWLDPHSVLMGLRNKARSMGARFVADEVTGLVRQGHGVSAVRLASGGLAKAAHVVNATGAWAKEICAMIDVPVPIEPMRRYEHYFECQDPIEPLPYLKDTARLAFRPEGAGYSGGVPSLDEPRGYAFGIDNGYFERAVWPALAHRFPKFEADQAACAPCRASTTRTTSTATSSSAPEQADSATSTCSPGSPVTASCTHPAAAGPWPNSS